jgi:hypothetical protein
MSNIHNYGINRNEDRTNGTAKLKPLFAAYKKTQKILLKWFGLMMELLHHFNSGCDAFFKDNVEETLSKKTTKSRFKLGVTIQVYIRFVYIDLEKRKISQRTILELGITQEGFLSITTPEK